MTALHCALLACALSFSACGRPADSAGEPPGSGPVRASAPIRARAHAHTPELDRLRAALERGDRGDAEAVIEAARAAGSEEPLLRARLSALDPAGTLAALRTIEAARAAQPADPDVYATAAEIYAAHGSFDTAWIEVQRGEKAAGEAAELLRARGVIWICRENGARKGLELLERALAIDPDLPFVKRPLAEAHLLVAKLEQQNKHGENALRHVEASLALDPTDIDARRLMSELSAARGDFAAAIALIEGLVAEGQPLGGELASLHKKAGVAALLEQDRARALEHFCAARACGLSDTELGSGARILGEEAAQQIARGVAAYRQGDFEAAELAFRAGLHFDPTSLAGRNHLAVVLIGKRQFDEAIVLWRSVLGDAQSEGIDLPEPVHVNLASALASSGDVAGARLVLEDDLARHPTGAWSAQTRQALAALSGAK